MIVRQLTNVLLVLVFAAGCSTTTPKERRVTEIYRDAGDGFQLAVSVEKESAQQLRYHLNSFANPSMVMLLGPLFSMGGDEWEILRKENLVYRWADAAEIIREEREILVEADKSRFGWARTLDMIRLQEVLYRYVITQIDQARREASDAVDQDVLFEDILKACEERAKADTDGESLDAEAEGELVDGNSEALVQLLSKMPYTVEKTDLPTIQYATTVTFTSVQVNGSGGYQSTTYTVNSSGSMPLVNPKSNFKVRIVRRFTAAKSGRLLGTVDDTYRLKFEKVMGDGVNQTLIK